MIRTQLTDGREVKILFQHDQGCEHEHEHDNGLSYDVSRGHTVCWLMTGPRETEQEIGKGIAYCSVEDNFCRETGRRFSLARAIENANLGREDAGRVLASYYRRPRTSGKSTTSETTTITV